MIVRLGSLRVTIGRSTSLNDGSSMYTVATSSTVKETQTEAKLEVPVQSIEIDMADAKSLQDTSNSGVSSDTAPPPSRICIYFHMPVTVDSHPIPHNSAYGNSSHKQREEELDESRQQ